MLIPLLQVNTANNLVNKHSIDNCMGNGNGGQKMRLDTHCEHGNKTYRYVSDQLSLEHVQFERAALLSWGKEVTSSSCPRANATTD